jgi:hypothetical protein
LNRVHTGSEIARSIGLRAALYCPRCNTSIPLGGPVLRAHCHQCQHEIVLSQALWQLALGEVDERSFEAGTTRTAAGSCRREHQGVHLFVEWSRSEVACLGCGHALPLVEPGSSGETSCSGCQMPMPALPAPPWLRTAVPGALEVYGVEYIFDAAALDEAARLWWVVFQGTPARIAAGQRAWVEQEVILAARAAPPVPGSLAPWVILVALAIIAFTAYTLFTGVKASPARDLLPILQPDRSTDEHRSACGWAAKRQGNSRAGGPPCHALCIG